MGRILHGLLITKHRRYHIPLIVIGIFFLFIVFYIFARNENLSVYDLYAGLALSLFRLIFAYLISLFVALIIAIPLSQSKAGEALIPFFDLLQNLPSFALIPLFVYIFGYTNLMVIIFAASSILWPILFYVLHALKTARTELNDAATVFGAVGWKRNIYYLLPLSFSAAVTGSIVGFSIGWEAVIGVEIIGLSSGIGVFLNKSLATDHTVFAIGLIALLLVVFVINRLFWMPLLKQTELYGE